MANKKTTQADSRRPAVTMDQVFSRTWLRNTLFTLTYVVAVFVSLSGKLADTSFAMVWLPVGVAVWWAVSCRSRREYALMCSIVFVVPSLYAVFIAETTLLTAVLVGFSHLLAGPVIGLVLGRIERSRSETVLQRRELRLPSQLFRIVVPRDVYHLILASLIVLPAAKSLSLLAIVANGEQGSALLLIAMILRDFVGVIAVAGPGIALSSPLTKKIEPVVMRELFFMCLVSAVLLAFIFGFDQGLPVVYLAMLPLYWSATRLPVRAAVLHAVVTSALALVLAIWFGFDPFAVANNSPIMQASAIQVFMTMCVLLSLVVSTTVQQHLVATGEFSALVSTIPDALLVADRRGVIFPMNEAAYDLVTRNIEGEFVMRRFSEVGGVPLLDAEMPDQLALRGEPVRGMRVKLDETEDGSSRYFSVSASPLQTSGEAGPELALVRYHDNSDEYWTQKQLRRSRDEARHLFEFAPQGVATLDESGVILQANRSLGDLLGVPAEALAGRRLDEFSTEGTLGAEVSAAFNQPGALVHADRCLKVSDGDSKKVAFSFRRVDGEDSTVPPLLVNAVDVTERQKLHELVSHFADHDSLTGLANRRRFETELARILEQSGRDNTDGALLLIDLDNFKLVNDQLGHQAGDTLLVEFAGLLKDCVRATDVIGRFGGDEFVIILPDSTLAVATAIGERIIATVRQRYQDQPNALRRITASIGIAMFSEAREQSVDPLLLADQLLYNAKNLGRNRVVATGSAKPEVETAVTRLTWQRLEHILSTEALTLELQPIAEIATGRVHLAEGLVRVAPGEGPVSTVELIRAVEQAELGPVLDSCVMRRGIRLIPELQRAQPGFRLTLNLSAQSLGSPEVYEVIVSELEAHSVPRGSLILEVTETAPIRDIAEAHAFQKNLIEHGVIFAIDDFGAGFDPYRILKELEFGILKIAGDYVQNVAENETDRLIVKSLADLAAGRSMYSAAEHVADEHIFEVVRELGVTYAQGHHIGKSLPLQEFIETHLAAPHG